MTAPKGKVTEPKAKCPYIPARFTFLRPLKKSPFVLKKLPVVLFPNDSRAYKKSVLRADEPTLRTPGKQIII